MQFAWGGRRCSLARRKLSANLGSTSFLLKARCVGPWGGSALTAMPSIVIIAAMKQEVAPLLHDATFSWKPNARITTGFGAWTSDRVALVCGGIGAKAATTATERAIEQFSPTLVISAGLAGALVPGLHVAQVVHPALVVSSSTGTRYTVLGGEGTLVTASGVAGAEGKRLLARHFNAEAADMEAAFVAQVAQRRGKLFAAVKSV